MKPTINHADILRLRKALGSPASAELVALLGFESKQITEIFAIKQQEADKPFSKFQEDNDDGKEEKLAKETAQNIDFNYAYLAVNEPLEAAIAPVLISKNQKKHRTFRPTVSALISLQEAKSHLQLRLQTCYSSNNIDIEAAIKTIAQNKVLEAMPFKQRQRLPDTLCLLIDLSARLTPAFLEFEQYLQAAIQLFGYTRMQYFPINYPPNASGELILNDGSCLNDSLQETTAVLYIGDQGAFAQQGQRDQHNWLAFWKQLKHAHIQSNYIQIAKPEHADPKQVKQLMAAVMRCEGPQTDRIRHMRQALQQEGTVEKKLAEELSVWNHIDLTNPGQIADVEISLLYKWSRVYQQIPESNRHALEISFSDWRQSLPRDTAAMELIKGASLKLEEIKDAKAINQLFLSRENCKGFQTFISSRQALLKHILIARKGNTQLTKATQSLSNVIYAQQQVDINSTEKLFVKQQNNKLKYFYGERSNKTIKGIQTTLDSPVLDNNGKIINKSGELDLIEQPMLLESNSHRLQFKHISRPDWAERIWHDVSGLHAAHVDGSIFKIKAADNRDDKTQWQSIHNAWSWASDFGVDEYGLWAELEIKAANNMPVHFKLRWIPAGEFLMGSPENEDGRYDDENQHKVRLSQAYWLAETSCTQKQWQAIMGSNPSDTKEPKLPVNQISWDDCQKFIKKLSQRIPDFYPQLPTEAQWEYACRVGTTTAYWWGDEFNNSKANKGSKLVQEDSYPANLFGLKSMSGNVYEWCNDYFGTYSTAQQNKTVVDPIGASSGSLRVLRGGSWFDNARSLRSAYRNRYSPGYRIRLNGLRLAGGFDPQASNSDARLTADRRAELSSMEQQQSDDRVASRKKQP